ncbi:MAG: SRPBCC domain-containing protein [Anaerolineae bacterium]|nr:SRPBCC domain-containing protein [Anaerolineae bacterium]
MDTLVIKQSVVVAADQDRVWRAITEPDQFSKWFGNKLHWDKLAVGEPMTFEGEGGMAIAIVEPQTRFAFRWQAATGHPALTLVTFRLQKVADGTEITVTEEGFEALPAELSQERFESNNKGWNIQMQNIATYLQGADYTKRDEKHAIQ